AGFIEKPADPDFFQYGCGGETSGSRGVMTNGADRADVKCIALPFTAARQELWTGTLADAGLASEQVPSDAAERGVEYVIPLRTVKVSPSHRFK
ncbi:MAG: hypothetical protein ACRETL_07800, partial [Gammaproteobacteria bacterium]